MGNHYIKGLISTQNTFTCCLHDVRKESGASAEQGEEVENVPREPVAKKPRFQTPVASKSTKFSSPFAGKPLEVSRMDNSGDFIQRYIMFQMLFYKLGYEKDTHQ